MSAQVVETLRCATMRTINMFLGLGHALRGRKAAQHICLELALHGAEHLGVIGCMHVCLSC